MLIYTENPQCHTKANQAHPDPHPPPNHQVVEVADIPAPILKEIPIHRMEMADIITTIATEEDIIPMAILHFTAMRTKDTHIIKIQTDRDRIDKM